MKKNQSYVGIIALIVIVFFFLGTPSTTVDSDHFIHNSTKQNGTVIQVTDDDLHIDCMMRKGVLQSASARILLEKVSYRLKKINNNLIFNSYFAILFKVAVIPSNHIVMILAVIRYVLSAAGRIITTVHLRDGKKEVFVFASVK